MPINKQSYQIQGMRQDNLVGTGFSTKFAHEIMNMRINTTEDYTTASWTTERGTKEEVISGDSIPNNFQPIGHSVINNQWVLFGKTIDGDYIFKLYYDNNTLVCKRLYPLEPNKSHDLKFNANNPLETLPYYESELIQKVYWTDNINQPRLINIAVNSPYPNDWQFDFIKDTSLTESVSIKKQQGASGQFPPCTVKYAITYFNKYGQESNIVWTSTLLYPTKGDRGLKEDELSGDTFVIKVNSVDNSNHFDYIRLYSVVRTTDNSTPIVRIVEDKSLADNPSTVTFYDSNTTGEIIDPTILQYLGGKEILAETFNQKDNTLFLGNLTLNTKALKDVSFNVTNPWNEGNQNIGFTNDGYAKTIKTTNNSGIYPWVNQLNNKYTLTTPDISSNKSILDSVKIFKTNEYYRFGIQCQDKKGNWSDVIWIGDYQNTIYPSTEADVMTTKFPVFKYILKQETALQLKSEGYKNIRLVCCYPTNNDRSVLAQGVLCPTLYNNKWKKGHAPDVFSSWFYRFGNMNQVIRKNEVQSIVDYQEYLSLNTCSTYHNSTESFDNGYSIESGHKSYEGNQIPVVSDKESQFFINSSILTFHSPEIEFDESIRTLDWSNVKLRVVGNARQTSITNKVYLEARNKAEDYNGLKGTGFNNLTRTTNYYGGDAWIEWAMTPSNNKIYAPDATKYPIWNDINVYAGNFVKASKSRFTGRQTHAVTFDYTIFPFQRKYLNNYMGDLTIPIVVNHADDAETTIKESSVIYNKVWSTLGHANTTDYINRGDIEITDCKVFDSNEPVPLKLASGQIYMGNINTIAPVETNLHIKIPIQINQGLYNKHKEINYSDSLYKNEITLQGSIDDDEDVYTDEDGTLSTFQGCYLTDYYILPGRGKGIFSGVSADPVPITFKSTPHCVIELNNNWTLPLADNTLAVAELYRDVDSSQRFGGTSEDALLNNQFLPCGNSVRLNNINSDLILIGDIGDSYYMRYDNLKTYPFTREDINQVVDIFSFMCETRINLDGRSDTNRGLIDNTLIDNTNFNYINQSYTQKDNIFTYHIIDDLSSQLDNFPNQLTWTKTKVPVEDIDTWTNITLASVANADGTIGEITKITNWKDNLLLFQEHGISQIGYNEKTAITTENGVPLELANSGKYTGLAYLSKEIGCQNKWSISSSKNGIFFIDDSRQEILTLGENFPSVSTLQGFDAFMIQQLPDNFTKWNPRDFNNFITYYDKLSNDVYFINKNTCLAWNEQSNSFTSFYNYENVPYISNIYNHTLMFKNGKIYAAREGEAYSNFFDITKPYWMTLVCDGRTSDGNAFPADKVFNNIEYRADCFNPNGIDSVINEPVFDKKAAWNGYQMYKEFDIDAVRKFNTWRVQLPRATYNINGILTTTRDRIRNPFCYIKLINRNRRITDRMILHDLAVYFDIK